MIIIEDWARMSFRAAWEKQKSLVNNLLIDSNADEHIITVEHDPVYTLGFHGNADNMLTSESNLERLGTECIRIERGGDVTYHGPGQLVIYPIINLHNHHLGAKSYIQLLEEAVITLLKSYGIEASSNNEAIGVWIDWAKETARKICAIGVKISHGVTMHGLALNVNTDLSAFSIINPCGFVDKGVTSMKKELGYELNLNKVASELSNLISSLLSSRTKA